MRDTLKSFKFASAGIKDAMSSEPNLRFHIIAAIFTISAGIYFKFNNLEFTILIFTILSVISLELINTLVEKIVDMHSNEISEEARIIKDISAGMVLISSVGAIIIGALLFLPKLFV